MRIPRIYVSAVLTDQSSIELDGGAFLHLRDVLRIKEKQCIHLFNGDGFDYQAQIFKLNKRNAVIEILDRLEVNTESSVYIHLLISICKSDRFDLSLQKSTELGVNEITPIYTSRTKLVYTDSQLPKKLRHWQRVIENACEQCGRARIPKLNDPQRFIELANNTTFQGLRYIADHSGSAFSTIDQSASRILCAIGPEGGFNNQELDNAKQCQFKPRKMGKRILRAETAVTAAMAILQYQFGDFA